MGWTAGTTRVLDPYQEENFQAQSKSPHKHTNADAQNREGTITAGPRLMRVLCTRRALAPLDKPPFTRIVTAQAHRLPEAALVALGPYEASRSPQTLIAINSKHICCSRFIHATARRQRPGQIIYVRLRVLVRDAPTRSTVLARVPSRPCPSHAS